MIRGGAVDDLIWVQCCRMVRHFISNLILNESFGLHNVDQHEIYKVIVGNETLCNVKIHAGDTIRQHIMLTFGNFQALSNVNNNPG